MDSTRQLLLNAAGPLFAERGFRATTVREICEIAKVNQAAINYHFHDKENFYIECVRHAAQSCMQRVPTPVWPPGTPPRQKLRDFVHMFLRRVAVDYDPAWHTQLILREMLLPTQACVEFVQDYVKPTFQVMNQIMDELLPVEISQRQKLLINVSIVGQIMHYRTARPVLLQLMGSETFHSLDVETLTEHITHFSLAAIEQIAGQATFQETV